MRIGLCLAVLALTASVPLGAQVIYETDFEAINDPSGVEFPLGPLASGGWTSTGNAVVSAAAGEAANGVQFVQQPANSSIRRDLSPATAPTQVLMRGFYKGMGDTELVLPSGTRPYAAVLGFRNIDQDTLTIAGYDGTAADWVENGGFTMATNEWHKIIVHLDYSDGVRTYSVSVNNQPVLQDVPFHTSALANLNGFESSTGAGSSVDTIGFFLSDGDYDGDGIPDAEELATPGADPFDPYSPNPNVAPIALELEGNSVDENEPIGTLVGIFSTTDLNPSDRTFVYTLVSGNGDDDNASFSISGNELLTAASFDYEAKGLFSVRVRTTDPGGLFFERLFQISILDVNEPPTAPFVAPNRVFENRTPGTTVGQIIASDPDFGDTITFQLASGPGSADNALFSVIGNELRTNAVFNFEARNSYSVRLRATDSGGLFTEASVTINIVDDNDAPTDIVLSNNTVEELLSAGSLVGTLTAIDEDVNDVHTFVFVEGEGSEDNELFEIQGNTLLTATTLDFETKSVYTVRIRAIDLGGLGVEVAFEIIVEDVNEAPTALRLQMVGTLPENSPIGTLVGTFEVDDPDQGDTHTFALVGGVGSTWNELFSIVGNELRTRTAIDFETVAIASIRVRATDSGGLFVDEIFEIEIQDVDESNPVVVLSANAVEENQPVGTLVGTFDVIESGTFTFDTFTIVGGNGQDAFEIVGNELRTLVVFDYEQETTRDLLVQASGPGAPELEPFFFTIEILNVNEAPYPVIIDPNFTAEENAPAGSIMAILLPNPPSGFSSPGFDPDGDEDTVTFTIDPDNSDNGGADFAIQGSNIISTRVLNFEEQSVYTLTIIATDLGGLTSTSIVVIALRDMPDPPTAVFLSNNVIAVNQPAGTLVGTLTTEDEDAEGTHTYSLVDGDGSDDNARFVIAGNRLTTAAPITRQGVYTVRIRSTDDMATSLLVEETFQITVRILSTGWAFE